MRMSKALAVGPFGFEPEQSAVQTNSINATMHAVVRQTAVTAARASRPTAQGQQKRTMLNWMTNYPDKVRS